MSKLIEDLKAAVWKEQEDDKALQALHDEAIAARDQALAELAEVKANSSATAADVAAKQEELDELNVEVKVGLAPVQRDGMEYEFTLLFDLTIDSHLATAAKDRTSLFDGQHFTPSPETGAKLLEWLDSGVDPVEASRALLGELKARVDEIDNVPHLENWWRAHQGEIVTLLPVDQERLKAHCATRKAAILQALTAKPEGKRKGKGNGEDRAAPAAIPTEQAA